MNELVQLLRDLEAGRFYGALVLKLEAGQIVLLKKTETLKPAQTSYGDNRGTTHGHTER